MAQGTRARLGVRCDHGGRAWCALLLRDDAPSRSTTNDLGGAAIAWSCRRTALRRHARRSSRPAQHRTIEPIRRWSRDPGGGREIVDRAPKTRCRVAGGTM